MTVIKFNDDVAYVAPNTALIKSTVDQMLKQNGELDFAFSGTSYLPSIRAKAQVLHTSLVVSGRKINEQLLAIGIATTKALKSLNTYRAAMTTDMSEDDLERNAYVRAQTIGTFKEAFTPAVQALQQQFKTLADVAFDPALTTTYKNDLQAQLTKLDEAFTSANQDTLLTAENLSAAGLVAPEVELVKLAVEQMKKTLEHVGEALNYITMNRQRDALIKQLGELKARNTELAADAKLITDKTTVIVSIHGLFESFFIARDEYAKIDQSIKAFVNHLALASGPDYEDQLVAAAPSLIAYLNDAC
jgi:hypothetical protein